MNTRMDVANGALSDGVKTPFGTLYAVENPDPNFPGISIFLKQDDWDSAEEILCVEGGTIHAKELRALVYPEVFDFDADPEAIGFNLNKPKN